MRETSTPDVPVKNKQLPHTERKAAQSFPMFCHTTYKTSILVILSVVIMSTKKKKKGNYPDRGNLTNLNLLMVLWSSSSWLGGRLGPGSEALAHIMPTHREE